MDFLQGLSQMVQVLRPAVAVDDHVIQLGSRPCITALENSVHQMLEGGWRPMQAKGEDREMVQSSRCSRGGNRSGNWIKGHLSVPLTQVQCGDIVCLSYPVQQIINPGRRAGVKLRLGIYLTEVDTDTQ